jgi:DNA modification methylase
MKEKPPFKIRDRILELRRVPATDLIPNPKNWRRHPPKQRRAMKAALGEIGYADALLARVDENGNLILIDGHLRAGLTPEDRVPVLILDVSEKEAEKVLATLDPLTGMAEIDSKEWLALLSGIESDLPDFADLLSDLSSQAGLYRGFTDENAIPDPPEEPITQTGDLFILGKHLLLCGDATNPIDVQRLFDGRVPNLMTSDPPYGVEYNPTWRNEAARSGTIGFAARREGKVANDNRVNWSPAFRLFPGTIIYLWYASLFGNQVQESLETCGFQLRSQIIWPKSGFAISRGHYHWQHECCFYAVRNGSRANWCGDRSQTTLWTVATGPEDADKNEHGTQKPVELMRKPMFNHTKSGDLVYDGFIGSGTTLIAAETCGRICLGIEIEPRYVDVSIRRWQNFTGQKATLDGAGKSFDEITAERNEKPTVVEGTAEFRRQSPWRERARGNVGTNPAEDTSDGQ